MGVLYLPARSRAGRSRTESAVGWPPVVNFSNHSVDVNRTEDSDMPKWTKWFVVAVRYERDVAKIALDMSLKRAVWWKAIASGVVLTLVMSVLTTDFDIITKGSETYGVKAAISALGTAAMVFVSMIPSEPKPHPLFDHILRAISGCFAFMAGVFWLLSETGGDIWLYVIVVAPIGVTMLAAMVFIILLSSMYNWESRYFEIKHAKSVRQKSDDEAGEGDNSPHDPDDRGTAQ